MHMCMCMYVHGHVHVHVSMCMCMYVHVHVHMCICVYMYACASVCACASACAYVCACACAVHMCMCICRCVEANSQTHSQTDSQRGGMEKRHGSRAKHAEWPQMNSPKQISGQQLQIEWQRRCSRALSKIGTCTSTLFYNQTELTTWIDPKVRDSTFQKHEHCPQIDGPTFRQHEHCPKIVALHFGNMNTAPRSVYLAHAAMSHKWINSYQKRDYSYQFVHFFVFFRKWNEHFPNIF